jgi:hypothetical protein
MDIVSRRRRAYPLMYPPGIQVSVELGEQSLEAISGKVDEL